MSREAWVRIVPFAVFMLFIGLQQALEWLVERDFVALSAEQLLYVYPLKALIVAGLLIYYWRSYTELKFSDLGNIRQLLASLLLGVVVFVLWINMDWEFATIGTSQGFDPTGVDSPGMRALLVVFRVLGAAVVVPIMEELFWRSFLLRYLISADFTSVRIGTYSLSSFLIGSLLFGLEHQLILAGIMAGIAYSLLLYRTRSIAHCVLAHAVTNLLLAFYVLRTGLWHFW